MTNVSIEAERSLTTARVEKSLKRRKSKNVRLQAWGIASIATAGLLLLILLASLLMTGSSAFQQTHITLEVSLTHKSLDPENPRSGNYRKIIKDAILAKFPDVTGRRDQKELNDLVSPGAPHLLREMVVEDTGLIGQTIAVEMPTSDPMDQFFKGVTPRDVPEDQRRISDKQIEWMDSLAESGEVYKKINWSLVTASDSRFAELAGLRGALVGSALALFVCLIISLPVGVAAGVYLEEFAPKNKWMDLVEININNLAAVPSVVFGLLGLAVFIQIFGLPRSAPLVGGMTLSLMTLPTIVIATRAALKQVPGSIRDAALGIGASKHQVALHHTLPLAAPGILTGTIIGLAQALGETAPLLLIGMNAFITSPPAGFLEPATALPSQIYIWSDSPERGFVAKTSAAILVLIGFLITMNALAIFLREKFQRKW